MLDAMLKLFISFTQIFTFDLHLHYLKPELGSARGISRQVLGVQCRYVVFVECSYSPIQKPQKKNS